MLIHGDIRTSLSQTLRLTSQEVDGTEQFLLHMWTRHSEADRLHPTMTGVQFNASHIPALRAALQQAEQMMLRAGLISAADYQQAGLSTPMELRELHLAS